MPPTNFLRKSQEAVALFLKTEARKPYFTWER